MRDFFLQIILFIVDKISDFMGLQIILLLILLFVGAVIGIIVLWLRHQRWMAGVLSAIVLASAIILFILIRQEKGELIQKPNFQPFYQPEWTAQINDGNANIKPSGNFVSILLNGEGTNSKAVELYQVVKKVSDLSGLVFNLRIKISDLENEGFPVAALTFMDDADKKVFQIIFTPDKHYNPEANDCLYPTRNGSLEDITISPLDCAQKRLPLEKYEKATKAKVSFYIAVPSGYRCRRCTIELHNVSLKHSQRRN